MKYSVPFPSPSDNTRPARESMRLLDYTAPRIIRDVLRAQAATRQLQRAPLSLVNMHSDKQQPRRLRLPGLSDESERCVGALSSARVSTRCRRAA